jgi:hypothetical protein
MILLVKQALNEFAKINAWLTCSFERVNLKPSLCKTVDAADFFFKSCSGLCLLAGKI